MAMRRSLKYLIKSMMSSWFFFYFKIGYDIESNDVFADG